MSFGFAREGHRLCDDEPLLGRQRPERRGQNQRSSTPITYALFGQHQRSREPERRPVDAERRAFSHCVEFESKATITESPQPRPGTDAEGRAPCAQPAGVGASGGGVENSEEDLNDMGGAARLAWASRRSQRGTLAPGRGRRHS